MSYEQRRRWKAQKERERSDYSPYCFVLTTQKYPTCINKGPTNLKHYNDPNEQRGGSPRSTHCFQEILHIPLMAPSVQKAHWENWLFHSHLRVGLWSQALREMGDFFFLLLSKMAKKKKNRHFKAKLSLVRNTSNCVQVCMQISAARLRREGRPHSLTVLLIQNRAIDWTRS